MNKSFGENKRKYMHKNKVTKKPKYSNHRNKNSLHKPVRNYVKSDLNHIKRNDVNDFMFPSTSSNTYTWWDCKPLKPKVFKFC